MQFAVCTPRNALRKTRKSIRGRMHSLLTLALGELVL